MGSYYGDFDWATFVGLDLDEDLIPEIDCPEPDAASSPPPLSSGVGLSAEEDQ